MPEYHTQKIGAQNFEMLIPLMKDCFGMDVNIEYFQWKYVQNPAGSFIGFVAIETETNEVGAYYGVIPQNFLVDGIEKTIYQSCDTMTHSTHRRRGLFKMLATECYKYLAEKDQLFVFGFGGAQSTPGFLKFGWKQVFNFKYYFKPSLACRLNFVRSLKRDNFIENIDIQNLDNFLNNIKFPNNSISSFRTSKHISWRTKNPNYSYKIIVYKPMESIQGYVIYYINSNKLILFDFLFSSPKAEKALFRYLSEINNKNGLKGIVSFTKENGSRAITLKKNGFISNPFKKGPLSERTPFIFFAEKDVIEMFASPDKWNITGYDHDAR
jgi:hypothetical protein